MVQATMGDKDKLVGILKGVEVLYIATPGVKNCAELVIKTVEAVKAAGVQFPACKQWGVSRTNQHHLASNLARLKRL